MISLENRYDPYHSCAKCGSWMVDDETKSIFGAVRIVRTCLRCKNQWRELPLDWDPVEDEERQAAYWKLHERLRA